MSRPSSRRLGSLGYMVREAFRRLWLSKRNTVVATLMIAAALTILGAFLLVAENLGRAVERQTGSTQLTIYLEPGSDEEDANELRAILDSREETAAYETISPTEALERFAESFPTLAPIASELDQNPFPWSIEVRIPEEWIDSRGFYEILREIRSDERVDDVQLNWEWIARLRSVVRTIRFVGLALGGALAIAAAFMIANVIRLTMVLYREEIGIMRLVGATESMIRFPFLLEGLIQGLAGGLLAVGLLALLYYQGLEWLDPEQALLANSIFVTFLSPSQLGWLIAAGPAAGLLGSWLAVRGTSVETTPDSA